MKIAHIINPFKADKQQDLFFAQPITFETMRTAQEFSKKYGIYVDLYSAQYSEDSNIIPEGFIRTPDLDRSVLDVTQQFRFQKPRRFPLVRDILDRLYDASDADYFIYTNVDISLMPFFYLFVKEKVCQGFDAFSITRRTIGKHYRGIEDIPLMYAEYGENHPGHDCFVFKRSSYQYYRLFDTCIGAVNIGRSLLFNMICNAQKFQVVRHLHLTFHLGDDRREEKSSYYQTFQDYANHNLYQVRQIVAHYQSLNQLANHPLIQRFLESSDATDPIPGIKPEE
jgi:hypothetical protein